MLKIIFSGNFLSRKEKTTQTETEIYLEITFLCLQNTIKGINKPNCITFNPIRPGGGGGMMPPISFFFEYLFKY